VTPLKILIVDDDEDIRLVSEVAVRRIGKWDVVVAATGEEALERARSDRPDVILLDVMMPRTDGPATLAMLRADPETAKIPVIFLTAKVQKHEVKQYLALGAAGVIGKPFDVLTLPDEIRRIVAGAGAPRADLDRDLQVLREAYCRKLPGELYRLGALLDGARETDEQERLEAAHRLVHMLKGTSGSYGLAEVSSELRRIEERLDRLLAGTSSPSEPLWDEIEHALRAARDRLAPIEG
jgi:CheY-like chemotaxis protein